MGLLNLRNALMAGKRMPTARDYVQSDLVAMWDGIENVGWGVHDSSERTTWIDLIGGHDMQILGNVELPPTVFDDNSFVNNNQRYGTLNRDRILAGASEYTIETCGLLTNVDPDAVLFQIRAANKLGWNVFRYGTLVYVGPSNMFTFSRTTGIYHVVGVCTPTQASYYLNGVLGQTQTGDFSADIAQMQTIDVNKFSSSGWGYPDDMGGSNWCGNIYFARVYSRALTADEIARNYNIDKARFGLP